MLEEYQRPLTADERGRFQRQLEGEKRALEQMPAQMQLARATAVFALIFLIVGVELNGRGPRASSWPFLIYLCALALSALVFDEGRKSRRYTKAAEERPQRILKTNNVYVLHVTSSAVAAIKEDEWDDYLFQVEPETLFYLDSIGYYSSAGFRFAG